MRAFVRGGFAVAVVGAFIWLVDVAPHMLAALILLIVAFVFLRAWWRIESAPMSSLASETQPPMVPDAREPLSFPGSSGVPGNAP